MNKQAETILRIICPHYADGQCECNSHQFGVRKCNGNCHYGFAAQELVENGIMIRQVGKWYKEPLPTPPNAKNTTMEHYRYVCPFCGTRAGKKKKRHCEECGAILK